MSRTPKGDKLRVEWVSFKFSPEERERGQDLFAQSAVALCVAAVVVVLCAQSECLVLSPGPGKREREGEERKEEKRVYFSTSEKN